MISNRRKIHYKHDSLVYSYVSEYSDVEYFIRRFVNRTIMNVMKIVEDMDDILTKDLRRLSMITSSLSYFKTEWFTCGSIGIRNGMRCIISEMRAWNNLPALKDWMFHVDFVCLNADNNTYFYIYEVIWSVPSAAYPEPQITVKIYFCVAVNRNYSSYFPVDVTYIFEGLPFVHRLGMIFQPKWLYDILDIKTMTFKTLKF